MPLVGVQQLSLAIAKEKHYENEYKRIKASGKAGKPKTYVDPRDRMVEHG
jgi:hypothetical protein